MSERPPPALQSLADSPVWVGFRVTYSDGAQRKMPIDPHTGTYASIDNPATWGTWNEVGGLLQSGKASFHALAIHADLNQTWIDFDHVLENGEMIPSALDIARQFDTYAETSLSGEGVHMAMLGRKPEGAGAKQRIGVNGASIELYDNRRFMIVTGNELEGSAGELRDCSQALAEVCRQLFELEKHPADQSAGIVLEGAIVELLAARFPQIEGGSRHDAALALSGALLRLKWSTDRIKGLLAALADAVFSDRDKRETRKKEFMRGVDDTGRKILNGGKAFGWPKLAELLGKEATEKLRKIVDVPKEEEPPELFPLKWTEANTFHTVAPATRQFVIAGMIPAGEVALLVGSGGSGKSMFALQMAMCVATGAPLFGRLPVQQSGEVIYLSAEDRLSELHRRVHSIWTLMNMYGIAIPDESTVGKLKLIAASGDDMNIITSAYGDIARTRIVEVLIKTIEQCENPVMVVLDPVSRFYAANENDNAERTAFVSAIEYISLQTKTAVVLVAHSSKNASRNGEITQDAARGGSAMVDGVRSVFNLTVAREEDAKKYGIREDERRFYLRLDHTKSNYASPIETLWLKRVEGGSLEAIDLKTDEKTKGEALLRERCGAILDLIERRTERLTVRMIRDLWCGADGPLRMSEVTFRRALTEGTDRGWFGVEKGRGNSGLRVDFIVPGTIDIPSE